MSNEDLVGDLSSDESRETLTKRNDVTILAPDLSMDPRELLFCYKYVELGRNASAAARAAGWTDASARVAGCNLLKRNDIRAKIIELVEPKLRKDKLDMEEILAQIHAIATFDRRKLYHPDGTRKLFTELDAQTAAAISHMGATDFVPFDKGKAIDMAMKHLGGFEKDNKQKGGESLSIVVTLT